MESSNHRLSINPILISLVLLFLLAIFIKFQFNTITPLSKSAPENVFSAERAFLMLEHLTYEQDPHPVDSKANRVVEERIISLLEDMGYKAEIQEETTCNDTSPASTYCTKVRNIIVRIPGTHPGKGILLSAHYDSAAASPGGSDAGAAVGTLLESARLLTTLPQPRNTIILLFNEGEEFKLAGARAFMKQHPFAKELLLAINIEARGSSGKSIMFETGENSGWLVKHYMNTSPAPLSSSLFNEVYKFLSNYTDLKTYKEHGLQGLNFAHVEREPHYHTPLDSLENLDKGSLQHHGDNVWGVLTAIMNEDLTQIQPGNLVFSDILGIFTIQWDEASSLKISIALLVLLTFCWGLAFKQNLIRTTHTFKSPFGIIVILITTVVTAFCIQEIASFLGSSSQPWRANPLPMQFAIWFGSLSVGLITGKWIAKNATPLELTFGLIGSWVLLSILTSAIMPGISFLFIIPSTIGVFGLLVLSKANHKVRPLIFAPVQVIFAIVTGICFMPVAYTMEIILSFDSSIVIAAMLSFITFSLLPLLVLKSGLSRFFSRLNYSMGLLVIASLTWTVLQAPYTELFPKGINLQYIQQNDKEAFILADKKILPDALESTFDHKDLSAKIPWESDLYRYKKILSYKLSPAKLHKIETINTKKGRKVHLTLNAVDDRLSDVKLYVPDNAHLESIEFNDNTYKYINEKKAKNGFYEFHCRGLSCGELEVVLNLTTQSAVEVMVAKVLHGLPSGLKSVALQRGSLAVESDDGDLSIIISEFKL